MSFRDKNHCNEEKNKNQVENHRTGEILSDCSSTGKERPWRSKKLMSEAVAMAFNASGEFKLAKRMSTCADLIRHGTCPKGHEKVLLPTYFCGKRLCPMCQWRRSLAMFYQVRRLSEEHLKRRKSDIPIFLTFTVPNCKGDVLADTIAKMSKAWNSLLKYKALNGYDGKSVFMSWFRALEISYNEKRNDFHPHFHVLVFVRKRYFNKSSGEYVTRDKLLELWQKAMRDSSITQVDMRKVYLKKDDPLICELEKKKNISKDEIIKQQLNKACGEVAKYATKQSSYINYSHITKQYWCKTDTIMQLHKGIFRKRLIAFGGLFKPLRNELKMQDIEDEKADLVNVSGKKSKCHCSTCQSKFVVTLSKWNVGYTNYIG